MGPPGAGACRASARQRGGGGSHRGPGSAATGVELALVSHSQQPRARAAFMAGLRDGAPIAAGYLAVSIAIGLLWAQAEYPPLAGMLMSAGSMSSTGSFAAISVMVSGGALLELAAATAVVNLRYVLMSLALSQRLEPGIGTGGRLLMAWTVTDEIFARGMSRRRVGLPYWAGMMVLPILGWSSGTGIGAVAGNVLPDALRSAAGILLFAMFIAIVVPPARDSRPVLIVVAVAGAVSIGLAAIPGLAVGWRIILASLIAAGVGATFLPVPDDGDGGPTSEAPPPAVGNPRDAATGGMGEESP